MTRLKLQFIHGLEGSPQGAKARYLTERFDALSPAMDTSDFEGAVRTQADAVARFQPDVVVGSSFGGAVAAALLQRGQWRGPTLLLAAALGHFGVDDALPPGVPVLVVHGIADDVVPLEASRQLVAENRRPEVELVEVDDGHRLGSLLEGEPLADLVRRVAAFDHGK